MYNVFSNMKKSIFIFLSFLLLAVFLSIGTSAKALGRPQGIPTNANSKANLQITPGEGKIKACQAREASIKTRMTQLTNLAVTMETKFATISARVEVYYTSKVVPSGKTVSNYDSLVAAIATQKTAVGTTLATAQTVANAFSCTNATPKAQVTKFTEDMKAVKQALKTYRTSIKNLIVAVHSVTGVENKATPTTKP